MASLAIICEGKTERNFAEQLLVPYFTVRGIAVDAVEIGIENLRHGGNVTFGRVMKDAEILLRDHDYVTTLVDYYRLGSGWGGAAEVVESMTSSEKAEVIERGALAAARSVLGEDVADRRVIFNVLMHEFEGLLFSDPQAIAKVTRAEKVLDSLMGVVESFQTPEDIDNGRDTAPSKRLVAIGTNYGKVVHGARIAGEIGLDAIRSKCPHFNSWMLRLENCAK